MSSESTYLYLSKEELGLISGAMAILVAQPFKDIQVKVNERLKEMADPEIQARHRAYRDAFPMKDGVAECDDGALVSEGDDPGAYVMGWIWVTNADAGLPYEEED